MRLNKINLLLAILLLSATCIQARGEEQGEIRMISGGPVEQNIELTGADISSGSNRPGSEFTLSWSYAPVHWGIAYCPNADIEASSIAFNSTINLPLSDINPGYYKLSEYIDAKIIVRIGGNTNKDSDVPLVDVDNKDPDYDCIKNKGSEPLRKRFDTATSGRVLFKLRKSLDSSAAINGSGTINVFGRLSKGGSYGSQPLFKINVRSAIDYLPEKCTFNNGMPLDVDFNNIGTEGLDGSKHPRDLNIGFVCHGGRFDAGDQPIQLSLQGKADGDYFQTSVDGLNIVLKEKGVVIKPNSKYSVSSPGNRGSWSLVAAPLARPGASLKDGEFNASATVVASFE